MLEGSTAVVVLGMHRSGTSAAMRVANILGVDLGPRLLPPEAGNNDLGFFEHADVVAIHQELLAAIGYGWDDVRAMPEGWWREARVRPFRDRLRAVLARDFAGVPLWGLKDPRMTRLLPLWRDIWAELGVTPAYLLMQRHPLEVARSLSARDRLSTGRALLLWLRSTLEGERETRGARRYQIGFDALMADWWGSFQAFAAATGITLPATRAAAEAEVATFLRPRLKHHNLAEDAIFRDPGMSPLISGAYRAILDAGSDPDACAAAFDGIAARLAEGEGLYDDLLRADRVALVEMAAAVEELKDRVRDRDSRIAERDARLAEGLAARDGMIAERDRSIAERDGWLAERDRRLARLERDAGDLAEALRQERAAREAIYRSTSWRVTRPLRALAGARQRLRRLLPFGRAVPLRLVPGEQVLAHGDGWRATGYDPHFVLQPLSGPLPSGWCEVSFRLESDGEVIDPCLYFDDGSGFSPEARLQLPHPVEGRVRRLVRLPDRVDGLRFDPMTVPGTFRLADFAVREISTPALVARLAWQELAPVARRPGRVMHKLRRAVEVLRRGGLRGLFGHLLYRELAAQSNYQLWVDSYDRVTPLDRQQMAARLALLPQPRLSVLMPVYNAPEAYLRAAIASVRDQVYQNWELCIADDASTAPHVRAVLAECAAADPRIKVVHRPVNGHISEASNSALALATGEFVALMDHDDAIPPHALYLVVEELAAHPDADLIYSDEDKIDAAGRRFDAHFKTDWNPDLFHSQNYISHLGVYRRALVEAVGGFRKGFEGSQDYDLTLRVVERSAPARIRHIPHVLYHWRAISGSTALAEGEKDYAHDAAMRALSEHFQRQGIAAEVRPGKHPHHNRVVYPLPERLPRVSVIVPTRDRVELLKLSCEGVLRGTDYPEIELLVIDNGSTEPATLAYFEALRRDSRVRVIRDERPFNFSALNNLGAREATGELLLLLNNDIEPIGRDWLSEMVRHALRPEIGIVGAKLYYPDDTIQHAGVVLGPGGVAGHFEKRLPKTAPGYFRRADLVQNFSAVTAACLMLRKAVFEEVGGLDEVNLAVAFNDVDFCLRVGRAGYRVLWTPYAELYHHESASRGSDEAPERAARFQREVLYMKATYGDLLLNDPFLNLNISLLYEQVLLAYPPRMRKLWREPLPAPAEAAQ
ncbi:MAG: hypothetical protein OHK0024_20890 [Thalassobaculales bacterium]